MQKLFENESDFYFRMLNSCVARCQIKVFDIITEFQR